MGSCAVCGRKSDKFYKAEIEGTEMIACEDCAKFGRIIHSIQTTTPKKQKKDEKKRAKTVRTVEVQPETEERVVPNYAELVRKARQNSGLNQEDFAKKLNEKLSVMKHVEQGSLTPSLKLAKKIENTCKITLIEEVQSETVALPSDLKSGPMTLGDMIKHKKKK